MASSNTMYYVLLGLTFCTWAVSISGVAAMQGQCEEDALLGGGALSAVTEFSGAMLPCRKIHRFWWFVISYEFIIIIGAIIATALGAMRSQKASWVGLFSVATLLYIQGTSAYLSAQDVTIYRSDSIHSKAIAAARTATAGFVMTCVSSLFFVLYIGTEREETEAVKATKAETI